MSRVPALILTAALTLTPAVVGACAAMLCAPGAAVQAEPDAGHTGHHEPVGTAHAHHDLGRVSVAPAPSARVRGVADHECCATDAARMAAVAVVTSRLDTAAAPDAAVAPNSADVARNAWHRHSRPPRAQIRPPHPVSAPIVLRI